MVKPVVVIERPLSDAQSVFDELTSKRRTLSSNNKLRNDALDNIPRYKSLGKDIAKTRQERKGVAADFDNKEPGHKRRIDGTKDEIDALASKLTGLALEHYKKTGTMLELKKKMRNGSEKKVRIGFSAQMSLF